MARTGATHAGPTDTTQAVDAFMAALDHPMKPQLEAVRRAILSADPAIAEGVKWNAPSFRTGEYFATANLRGAAGLRIIFHLGARARALPAGGVAVEDPQRLLEWLAPDRAMVAFTGEADVAARRDALVALVRAWIRHV